MPAPTPHCFASECPSQPRPTKSCVSSAQWPIPWSPLRLRSQLALAVRHSLRVRLHLQFSRAFPSETCCLFELPFDPNTQAWAGERLTFCPFLWVTAFYRPVEPNVHRSPLTWRLSWFCMFACWLTFQCKAFTVKSLLILVNNWIIN